MAKFSKGKSTKITAHERMLDEDATHAETADEMRE